MCLGNYHRHFRPATLTGRSRSATCLAYGCLFPPSALIVFHLNCPNQCTISGYPPHFSIPVQRALTVAVALVLWPCITRNGNEFLPVMSVLPGREHHLLSLLLLGHGRALSSVYYYYC